MEAGAGNLGPSAIACDTQLFARCFYGFYIEEGKLCPNFQRDSP